MIVYAVFKQAAKGETRKFIKPTAVATAPIEGHRNVALILCESADQLRAIPDHGTGVRQALETRPELAGRFCERFGDVEAGLGSEIFLNLSVLDYDAPDDDVSVYGAFTSAAAAREAAKGFDMDSANKYVLIEGGVEELAIQEAGPHTPLGRALREIKGVKERPPQEKPPEPDYW